MTATRNMMLLMALVLAAATLATAAVGFAGPKKKKPLAVTGQVADSVQITSQRILRLKLRASVPQSD